MKNNTFREIADVLTAGEIILIFPHIVMDGDAIGSGGALCQALRDMGKTAYVITEDELAANLKFIDEGYTLDYQQATDLIDKEYISVCVDCSETKRFPKREEIFNGGKVKVCIDHHKTAAPICDYNYVDPDAAATCELIYVLLKEMGVKFTPTIADCIYTGIATDTGNFQYSNTTKKTHEIVASLYDIKDGFNDVSLEIYENESFEKLALQGEILQTATSFADGKGLIAWVTQKMLKDCNATMNDSEGTVSKLRSIGNVEVAVLLRENSDGTVKASLRSKKYFDVAELCQEYGGGGHTRAAGFTVDGTVLQVKDEIIEKVSKKIG